MDALKERRFNEYRIIPTENQGWIVKYRNWFLFFPIWSSFGQQVGNGGEVWFKITEYETDMKAIEAALRRAQEKQDKESEQLLKLALRETQYDELFIQW